MNTKTKQNRPTTGVPWKSRIATGVGAFSVLTMVSLAGLGVIATSMAGQAETVHCDPERVIVTGGFGQAAYAVVVADDARERAQGLMHVSTLPSSSGMLFVYEAVAPQAFWMKNTLIALDMLFIDERGVIVHIHENAVPHDLTPIPSRHPVRAVLEIGGGQAQQLGIKLGDTIRHPSFGPLAEDACAQ